MLRCFIQSAGGFAARAAGVVFTLVMLFGAGAAGAQLNEPEAVVDQTTQRMLTLIDEAKSYVDQDPERFYDAVEELLDPVIDFPRFARSVMAVYYKRATPEQRKRFEEGFKESLLRTYAKALTEFNNGGVNIVPSELPSRYPDRASVKQEIRSEGDVYPVVYSMARSDDGGWQVRNIIINGINMGLTYRNQFASAVNDPQYGGDMDRVIDGWVASLGTLDTGTGDEEKSPRGSGPARQSAAAGQERAAAGQEKGAAGQEKAAAGQEKAAAGQAKAAAGQAKTAAGRKVAADPGGADSAS
jgi:phospholipid transport system substrate-binding protein